MGGVCGRLVRKMSYFESLMVLWLITEFFVNNLCSFRLVQRLKKWGKIRNFHTLRNSQTFQPTLNVPTAFIDEKTLKKKSMKLLNIQPSINLVQCDIQQFLEHPKKLARKQKNQQLKTTKVLFASSEHILSTYPL